METKDDIKVVEAPPKRKGGWQKGRARGPSPFRKKPVVEAAAQPAAAEPKKLKGAWQMKYSVESGKRWSGDFVDSDINAFDFPPHVVSDLEAEGFGVVWATETVFGRPTEANDPHSIANRERNGWVCVDAADNIHPDIHSVAHGGLRLMIKPMALVKKALAKQDRDAASVRDNLRRKHGEGIPGAMGADHPSARGYNRHRSSFEKVSVPEDGE